MRHLLRMLDARTLDDTIAAVALVRPGPAESGMKEAFCRRRRGLEPAAYLHPRLEPVLASTHGVLLYEEDVMRVAAALAGLSLAEGDELRRAIGARAHRRGVSLARARLRRPRACRAGVDGRAARRGVARAHALRGLRVLQGARGRLRRARLPERVSQDALPGRVRGRRSSTITPACTRPGCTSRTCGGSGVVFRAPCVQRSSWDTTLEIDDDGRGARRARRACSASREATGERIVAAREPRAVREPRRLHRPRARPTLPELESLVLAGALDWTRAHAGPRCCSRRAPAPRVERGARATAARAGARRRGRTRAPAAGRAAGRGARAARVRSPRARARRVPRHRALVQRPSARDLGSRGSVARRDPVRRAQAADRTARWRWSACRARSAASRRRAARRCCS